MKLKICIAVMLLLCAISKPNAQTTSINHSIPDSIATSNLKTLNYSKPAIRLIDFKQKHVLLDFFSIYCGSCIFALPHLDSLQQANSSQLQVLVISRESSADVKKFLAHNPHVQGIKLAFVVEDSLLKNIFPFTIIPHEVWLDDKLTVRAITDQYEVSENNVSKFLNNETLHLPLKQDELSFSTDIPLFEQGNGGSLDNLVRSTVFSRYLPGVPAVSGQTNAGAAAERFFFINISLPSLYEAAWGLPPNRLINNLPDTINRLTQHTEWNSRWLYSYEITLPANYAAADRNKMMREDVQRFTGTVAQLEDKRMPCWYLVKTKPVNIAVPLTPIEDAMINVQKGDSTSTLVLHISDALSDIASPPIVFDSSRQLVDTPIIFSPKEKTIAAVQDVLQAYGYALVQGEVTLPMLVIAAKPD